MYPVAGVNDAAQFVVRERRFVGETVCAYRRLDVGADGVLSEPFAVGAEAEKRPQRSQPFGLRPRAEIEASVKNVDVGGGELVEHRIAPRIRKSRELLCERPVFSERRGRYLRAFPVAEKNLDRIGNRDATGPGAMTGSGSGWALSSHD